MEGTQHLTKLFRAFDVEGDEQTRQVRSSIPGRVHPGRRGVGDRVTQEGEEAAAGPRSQDGKQRIDRDLRRFNGSGRTRKRAEARRGREDTGKAQDPGTGP